MSFIQNDKTKNFVKQVKSLVDSGAVGSLTEIADEINWNRSALSQALNGSRNVPPEIIARFTNSYKENEAIEASLKEDFREKYLKQLEKNNAILEKNLAQMEQRLKAVDKAFEQIEIMKGYMNRFEENQRKIAANLKELGDDQFLFGAIQQGWQEYWAENLPLPKQVPPHVIKEMIRKKAASLLATSEEKGKTVFFETDSSGN